MVRVKLLHFLLDRTRNNEFERQMVYHELMSIHHYLSLVAFTYHHYNYVYEVFDPLIKSPYLSDKQKQRLIDIKTKKKKKKKGIK